MSFTFSGSTSSRIEEKWSDQYYLHICQITAYWKDYALSDTTKAEASHLLQTLLTYGVVMDNTSEAKEKGDVVSVKLFQKEYAFLHEMLGVYAKGYPEESDLNKSVDYIGLCKEETQKYKEKMNKKKRARQECLEKEKRRKQEEKETQRKAERDIVRQYLDNHASKPLVKKAMAADLGISYEKCLRLYREVTQEIMK